MGEITSKRYLALKATHPDFMQAMESLGQAARAAGPLDKKTAHLIQLAAAAASHSEGAVHSHTRRALEAGAKPEEIHHTILLLVSTVGFPTVVAALTWADDIIEAAQ
jgi:4-carboxymuconolactone decarboxylase